MKYKKPQKKNPHEITIHQHTFPKKSIERFTREDGLIEVFLKPQKKKILTKPNDKIFCSKRVWDQRAESGFMKEIEDNFQEVAHRILENPNMDIGEKEKLVINDFFCLWNIRFTFVRSYQNDHKLGNNIKISPGFSENDQEVLEKQKITTFGEDGTLSGHHIAGVMIQKNLLDNRMILKNASWGILQTEEGEFLVPDNHSVLRIVPLTPNICLYSPSSNDFIKFNEVKSINRYSVESSRYYYFSRDLSRCPM